MGRAVTIVSVTLALTSIAGASRADNTLNSNEKPQAQDKPPPNEPKNDFTIVPAVGGSTDIGIGGGFFAALTRSQAGREPYVWNIEAAWFLTFGLRSGRVDVPYNDFYMKWTMTRFLGAPLELELRPSFTDEEALYYYGMGDASTATPPPGETNRYYQYGRIHPSILADLNFRIVDHVAGKFGARYTGSWLNVPSDSKLAADERNGSSEVRSLIGPTAGVQSVVLFHYGIEVDTRDNETSPRSGTWDAVTFKASPGGSGQFPYRYGEVSGVFRAYVPVASRRVVLAMRAVGDLLFGDVPFVDLPRFEDSYALGGAGGARGIPGQRYYGRVKVFGNFEVRTHLLDFHLFKKAMTLGTATFLDGGRVWADFHPHPELDGTGLGLKYGVGAGLRLGSGAAFVLRGDVAWSPDATPIGGYLAAGELF